MVNKRRSVSSPIINPDYFRTTSDIAAVKKSKSSSCRRGLRLVGRINSGVASLRSLPHALQKACDNFFWHFGVRREAPAPRRFETTPTSASAAVNWKQGAAKRRGGYELITNFKLSITADVCFVIIHLRITVYNPSYAADFIPTHRDGSDGCKKNLHLPFNECIIRAEFAALFIFF